MSMVPALSRCIPCSNAIKAVMLLIVAPVFAVFFLVLFAVWIVWKLFVRWPMGYICSPSGHVKAKPSKGGYCIVTGASGGIGKELCFDLAKRGYNLILVARSADLLEAMVPELKTASKDRIQTHVIVADLSKPGAAQALFDAAAALLTPEGGHVDYLLNNAGFATESLFDQHDPANINNMIQLNCVAAVLLTRLFLPGMIRRGCGGVLQVASIVSFCPGPSMAMYHGTKALLRVTSEAINYELHNTGVSVSCLNPGATATGFAAAGGTSKSWAFDKLACLFLLSSKGVAHAGINGMLSGDALIFTGLWVNQLLVESTLLLPRSFVHWFVYNLWTTPEVQAGRPTTTAALDDPGSLVVFEQP